MTRLVFFTPFFFSLRLGEAIDDGFRRIRDATNALKDACRHVATLAEMEIRAWKDAGASAPAPAPPAAKAS